VESEYYAEKVEEYELNSEQEGQTGVIELKAANDDGDAIAEDDPDAVRLMIDYFYLSDYDPGLVTETLSTDAANNIDTDVGAKGGAQQTEVKDGGTLETQLDQRDEHTPGPEPADFADHAVDRAEEPIFSSKRKKKKGKATKSGREDPSPVPQSSVIRPVSLPMKELLTMHAKMFNIAAKYNIEPLMDIAVMKFRSIARSSWDVHDLITALPIVYNQTAECDNELRDIIEVMVLENAHKLVIDPGFGEAVGQVNGLAWKFFRRLGALSRHQKICRRCGCAYVSRCALDGCRPAPFGGYHSHHDCDLSGPCRNCIRDEQSI
jgi:hypothetical protein